MKTKQKAFIFLIVVSLIVFNSLIAFADSNSDPAAWAKPGAGGTNKDLDNVNEQIEVGGRSILRLIQTFGNVAGLLVLATYGIRWIMSRNDSSARKELKDKAINYVIGAIIFFGAIPLYRIIHSFSKAFESTK